MWHTLCIYVRTLVYAIENHHVLIIISQTECLPLSHIAIALYNNLWVKLCG